MVGEAANAPASLSDYKSAAVCVAANPLALQLPHLVSLSMFAGSATLGADLGDRITCIIVNTRLPSLQ
jgi:hypothetical protein